MQESVINILYRVSVISHRIFTPEQRATVLSLMGVSEEELSSYTVITKLLGHFGKIGFFIKIFYKPH